MSTPAYSPASGNGTVTTDPQSGVSYSYNNGAWTPVSSGANQGPMSVGGSPSLLPTSKPSSGGGTTGGGSTGGGASDTQLQQLAKTDRNPEQERLYQQLLASANNGGVTDAQINAIYQPTVDYLGQAEANIRNQYPQYQQEAQAMYDANKAQLGSQSQAVQGQLGLNQQQVQTNATNAENQSLQTFQELQAANRARFGGSSSAGGAISELQGRELQRGLGQNQQTLQQSLASIQQQKVNVDQDYNSKLQQLEVVKMQGLNQAQRDFQDRLLEISRQRGELESNKAQYRVQELQSLRDKIFAVNSQAYQFQQQLDAQKQAAQLQLDANLKQIQAYASAGAFTAQNTNTPTANLTGAGSTTSNGGSNALNLQGAVSSGGLSGNPNDALWQQYLPTTSTKK